MAAILDESQVTERTMNPLRQPSSENGDCFMRAEFEHRYDAMPNLRKTKLIDGVAQTPSSTPVEQKD